MTTRQGTIATSPFTGYRQVESFGNEEEYLSEEDVFYVTLDLGTVEPTLLPSSSTYRLVVSTGPYLSWHHYKANKGLGYTHTISAAFRLLLQRSA